MVEERSAGFVVFRRQAGRRLYLLLQHRDGRWDFPKGNIERGETTKDAALRELREETGISMQHEHGLHVSRHDSGHVKIGWVREIRGWDKTISYFYKRAGVTVHKEVAFFLGEAADGRVTISHEHSGFGWFSCEDAMAKAKFENARSTIASAEKFLSLNPGK
jgi:8-oxo-dGTP pyrophosphatase MutT (NUDIX family)